MSLVKKDNEVDMTHIKSVCKIGQREKCCRYLIMGQDGFECAKETSLKTTIDLRVNTMNAQGDNCVGYDEYKKQSI